MLSRKSTILYSLVYLFIVPVVSFIQLEGLPDTELDTMGALYITILIALVFPILLYFFDRENTKEVRLSNLITSYITIVVGLVVFFGIILVISAGIGGGMKNVGGSTPT